jgi:2-(1,2-epoxy-1,2-dihydrophenyl)acetyl-CoA isomerase
MKYSTIDFEVKDSIARITLNRPDASNSINLELAKDLMYAAMSCSEDPTVRAVIITGAGKVFCPGGDVKTFATKGKDLPYYFRDVTTHLHAAVSRLARLDAPVIAAVNGVAAGAGMGLVCASDFALAAESARFTMAYTRIGLAPDGGSTYYLTRLVGLRKALDLTLTNRQLSAKEALELGIVSQIVPDAELTARVEALAIQIASGATKAYGAAKRLMHSSWTETLETQMELESQALCSMAHTEDAQEAIAAFAEKRTPKLKGK